MIVIKTANGDRFINEAEVKNVQHNKSACIVTIKFKDGTFDVAYGVESMYYTNKPDTEIRDNGLMLGGMTTDKEYWKASFSAFSISAGENTFFTPYFLFSSSISKAVGSETVSCAPKRSSI